MENILEYKELYHYDDKRSLIMNKMTGDVRMMKRLKYYDIEVYKYLAENTIPHIPKVYSYEVCEDKSLLVTEEVVQGNTFDVIISDYNMKDKDKLKYFFALLEGLTYLHNAPKPIIHRDLKPSNIMVTDRDDVMILDYDAAKIYKPHSDGDTTFLGTEGVAAPEQYGFMQSDPRSDIYAVGKMLAAAFPNNTNIQQIASKATSFDPKNRYISASELADALDDKLTPGKRVKRLLPMPGFRTRKWWKILLAILCYPTIIYFYLFILMQAKTTYDLISEAIELAIFIYIVIDTLFSWTGFFDFLPFSYSRHFILRYFIKLLFIGFIVFMLVFADVCTRMLIFGF